MCFNGSQRHRNLPYISGPVDEGNCPSAGAAGNIASFCEAALKISGPSPIPAELSVGLGGEAGTSVTGATIAGNMVALVGTRAGNIVKVLLSGGGARVVDSFHAGGGLPILPGLTLLPGGRDLLVLTPRTVSRVRVAECGESGFCGECLARRDPFCGWCSLENECSLAGECPGRSWLALGARHQCVHLESIQPSALSLAQQTNISLQISSLPELPGSDQYQCVYGGSVTLAASKVAGGLVCPAPPPSARPPIPPGQDHVTVSLAVTARQAAREFVSTQVMVFRCETHSTCLDCLTSPWPCAWCIYTNRCAHLASQSSTCQEAIVSSDTTSVFSLLQDNPSQLISYGSQHCPRVQLAEQIFVPNNVPQELGLTVTNLPDLSNAAGQVDFLCQVRKPILINQLNNQPSNQKKPTDEPADTMVCQVEVEGAKFRVPARLDGSRVVCDRTTYRYESAVPQYNASISVVWDSNNLLDRANVTLYKCELVGSYKGHPDCSLCMTRAADLGCVW